MTKTLRLAAFGAAVLGMGIAMPSCPGQQAMQQQIDALKSSETEMKTKVQTLERSNQALKEDLVQAKTLLAQVSNTVLEQKTAIEKLDEAVKQMAQTRATPKPAKSAPAKGGATKKKH